jgi:hypothetical protein
VVTLDTARTISLQLRATFCNKVKTQAALGIVWTSACGMLLRCTSLFCGRVGEEALVWLHHKLLDEFPAEFAALVDKGFTHCVGAYLHLLHAYYPAFVHDGEIGVQGVKDSKKQSADRYVVEVFYSRVKRWLMLRDRARWANIHMLDDAWCIALAGTDHDRFLRAPNNAAAIQAAMRDLAVAINKSTETERAAWPKDTEMPSYMQRPADLRAVN